MADNDISLNDRVFEMTGVLSAIKQGQDDLHARLFVDGGGILPMMFVKLNALEKDMTTKADASDIVAVKKEITTMNEKRAYHVGYAAGAGSVATLVIKYLAGKVGLHF